jgi:hypothetical protein
LSGNHILAENRRLAKSQNKVFQARISVEKTVEYFRELSAKISNSALVKLSFFLLGEASGYLSTESWETTLPPTTPPSERQATPATAGFHNSM